MQAPFFMPKTTTVCENSLRQPIFTNLCSRLARNCPRVCLFVCRNIVLTICFLRNRRRRRTSTKARARLRVLSNSKWCVCGPLRTNTSQPLQPAA